MASSTPPRSTMGSSSFSIIRRNTNSGEVLPLHIDSASILLQSPMSSDSSCSSTDSSSFRCSPQEPSKLPLSRHHSAGSLTRRSHRDRPLPTTWDDVHRGSSSSSSLRVSRSNGKESSNYSTWNISTAGDSSTNNLLVFLLGGLFFCGIWAGCYLVVNTYLASHDAALKLSLRETEILPMTRVMEAKVFTLERENKVLQERYQQATIMQQHQKQVQED